MNLKIIEKRNWKRFPRKNNKCRNHLSKEEKKLALKETQTKKKLQQLKENFEWIIIKIKFVIVTRGIKMALNDC